MTVKSVNFAGLVRKLTWKARRNTMTLCPPDCMERHSSNSRWIASALKLAIASFVTIGGLYIYCDGTFAKSSAVDEIKQTAKEQRAEIREEFRMLNAKIDALTSRGK